MKWDRLSDVRTVLLILGGSAALIVAAWGLDWRAGLGVAGALAFLLEYLTGERPDERGVRS